MLRVAALVPLAVALAVACGGGDGGSDRASPTAGEDLTRSAEAGGITVEGTWLVADSLGEVEADLSAYPLDGFVLVEIAFTTHSGDLNKVDMEEATTLSEGRAELRPEAWISLSDDSHHRGGIMVFKRTEADGPVELTVDLGDSEVALVWEVIPT
jgi:hypothetical protein